MNDKYDSIAWCPNCFDSMRCIEIKDGNGMCIEYEYFCIGCDKVFKLMEKSE